MKVLFQPLYATTEDELNQAVAEMESASVIAVDTETTGLNTQVDVVICWSFCTKPDRAWMVLRKDLPKFKHIFEDPSKRWVFHNWDFDVKMLRRTGIRIAGLCYDTMVLDWLEDENKKGRKLSDLGRRHIGISKTSFDKTFGTTRSDPVSEFLLALEEDPKKAAAYATKDAWLTFLVWEKLKDKLSNPTEKNGYRNLLKLYEDHLWPVLQTLDRMETRGVFIDTIYLPELGNYLDKEILKRKQKIFQLTGYNLNVNASRQLANYFYNELGLPVIKVTPKGSPSVDKMVLDQLAESGNPVARIIVEERALLKLKSTYIDGLLNAVDKRTGRIYSRLRLGATVTGRLASSNPNLQNIPSRTELGKKIREAFIPPGGKALIVGDYGQIEMRILAHKSQDENLISIIREGRDIHAGTASLVFSIPYEDIIAAKKAEDPTEEQKKYVTYRSHAKTIGFGLIYGVGNAKLARTINTSVEEAARLKAQFFRPFPRVKAWIEETKNKAHTELMVETLIGRPRRLPTIRSDHMGTVKEAERQAVNTPIQGSAADIVNQAMVICDNDPRLKELGAELLLQVHDELMFEVPEKNSEEALDIIKDLMEHPGIELKVPLVVDIHIGYSWAEAK